MLLCANRLWGLAELLLLKLDMGRSPSQSPSGAAKPPTIYETMLEQHRAIDRLLEELLDLLLSRFARAGSPPSLTAYEDAPRRLLLRLRKTLAAHIELEDGILFREFEAQSGLLVDGPTATLRREHQVILARLDELLVVLPTEPLAGLQQQLTAFCALYTDHCRREDVLYEICERLLSPEQHARAQRLLQRRVRDRFT